jgi:hypothetical protein
LDTSGYGYGWSSRYISSDQMIKNITPMPVLVLIFYPNTANQRSFPCAGRYNKHVLPGKIRMELKCHWCDITDVDVSIVFYHLKMLSDG